MLSHVSHASTISLQTSVRATDIIFSYIELRNRILYAHNCDYKYVTLLTALKPGYDLMIFAFSHKLNS